jgi:hypothetical protein
MKRKTIFLLFQLIFLGQISLAHEGMWIPSLLKVLEGQMQSEGLKLTAEDIYSINKSSLKDAIVHFGGGCTAEVVSEKGLILTNHHCGYSQIQQHSSLENNLLKNGFWAMNQKQELTNPGLTATFIVRIEDVTNAVLKGIEDINAESGQESLKNNLKSIKEAAVLNTNYEASIKPFFYGNKYFMIVSKTYKDVRLVGAPPSALGKFGGDTDNWVWPRHTCDFSVFRIYADENNQPSEISEDNIPYKAPKALDIAIGGVKENDFTMVFGFPGTTEQFLTSKAVENYINQILPARIEMRKNSLKHIDAAMAADEATFIKYASKQSRISNAYKKWVGQDLGLRKKEAVQQKLNLESQFLNANSTNKKLLNELFEIESQKIKYELAYSLFIELWYYGPEMIRFSNSYNKLAKSKDFEKDFTNKKNSNTKFFKNYDLEIDKKVFKSLIPIYLKHLSDDLEASKLNELIIKHSSASHFVDYLYSKSKLVNDQSVKKLLSGTQKSIASKIKKDPICQLSDVLLDHFLNEIQPKLRVISKKEDILMKKYVSSLMTSFPEKTFWADANSTLRLTYGKVEGSSPRDGMNYNWFTTIDGIVEKYNTGEADFKVPERLLELHKEKNYGQYGNNGTLNICFLGSNHTTGGNSGSPALDAYGRLVGINFDRSWESTMSDVLFDKDICRNIMVDIRYVLWVIDIYAGAGHLVEEMNLVNN